MFAIKHTVQNVMVINKHHTVFKKYAVFKCILGHAQ